MRYLKVSILIGILLSFVLAGLYESGSFRALDPALANLLGYPPPAARHDFKLQYILIGFFSIAIAWTTIDITGALFKSIIAAVAALEVLIATAVLHFYGVLFSPACSLAAIGAAFGVGLIYSRSEPGKRKAALETLFADRISKRTTNALIDAEAPLRFAGQKCEASILVCDILNHEQLAATMPVADYVAMNTAFLGNAADFLVGRGGYLEDSQAHTLRVIFGTPLADSRHAITACEAALGLVSRLDAINQQCDYIHQQRFDYRLSINSGEIIVATYGSQRLAHFSVAGEPVDFARRLCRANAIYGSHLLIGAATFADAERSIEVRPMEILVRDAETHAKEEIYELLCLRDQLTEAERQRRDNFWKALILYRERLWKDALALLLTVRPDSGNDGPVEFYIRRIEQLQAGLPELDIARPPI